MSYLYLEGLDGTGKSTQIELLKEYISISNMDASIPQYYRFITFPQYESEPGKEIRKYLNGEHELSSLPRTDLEVCKRISHLYTKDRYNYWISTIMSSIHITNTVFERYSFSNVMYQGAYLNDDDLYKLFEYCMNTEYKSGILPIPNKIIILVAPIKLAMKNIKKRNTTSDLYETEEMLSRVYNTAYKLNDMIDKWNKTCDERLIIPNVTLLDVSDGDGNMRDMYDIKFDIIKLFDI